MIKKERIIGREVSLSLSPMEAIKDFFGAEPTGVETIPFFGEQYRTFRKKRVSEGRATQWGAVTPATEKERRNLKRLRESHKRTGW